MIGLVLPLVVKLALLGGAAWMALRGKSDGKVIPGNATADPILGQRWSATVNSVYLPGTRMPAVPLTRGGSMTGWYHPESHKFIAITDASKGNLVTGLNSTADFPPSLPK